MSKDKKEAKEKLLKLMHDVVSRDNELREKYQVGEKFRFIRDRLQALRNRVEEGLTALQKEEKSEKTISEDETLVYVYLYNAQGMLLQSWQKLLKAGVFYEYSVNRPIYAEKTFVETFIRHKPNKAQHAFITVAVKKIEVISSTSEAVKDLLGSPIIKVKEGSLQLDNMIAFTHTEHEYQLNEEGELIKKR